MEHPEEKSEWTGIKGKYGGWLLNSPMRRLAEIFILGDATSIFLKEISKVIKNGDETILDVGAGSGYYSLPVAKQLSSGKVICLDISDEMINHLERKASKKGLTDNIEILRSSASSISLSDGSVDLVMSGSVLHELSRPETAFKEMTRVLKGKGWMFINDFCTVHGHHNNEAHGPFSIDELKDLFSKNGVAIIKMFRVKHCLIGIGRKVKKP